MLHVHLHVFSVHCLPMCRTKHEYSAICEQIKAALIRFTNKLNIVKSMPYECNDITSEYTSIDIYIYIYLLYIYTHRHMQMHSCEYKNVYMYVSKYIYIYKIYTYIYIYM